MILEFGDVSSTRSQGTGAWDLIEKRTITSGSTVESFTALSGELDEMYKITARWVNGAAFSSTYTLEPNGISASQSGRALKAEFTSGPSVNVITALNICGIQGMETGMTDSLFYARREVAGVAQNRFMISSCVETRPTTGDVFGEYNTSAWLDTTTNIDRLDIRSSQPSGIGVGTTIWLYKAVQ